MCQARGCSPPPHSSPTASAGSELERPGPAKACEGTRVGSWHCPLLCPWLAQIPALTVTPRAPSRDEGRARAAAIPEDAKQNKHCCDPQKHKAQCFGEKHLHLPHHFISYPFLRSQWEVFSLALDAGDQAQFFGCPPAIHTQFPPC